MTSVPAMSAAAQQLDRLQDDVGALLARLTDAESRWKPWIDSASPDNHCSAINLVHYWALSQADLHDVERRLTEFGLSSLSHSTAHIRQTLLLVSAAIAAMRGHGWIPAADAALPDRNADDLLGLVGTGTRIARIDCAHDDATAWKALAAKARTAAAATGDTCLISLDLGGTKLRTGPLQPGPQVVRLRPTRNAHGQVVAAGRGWLTSAKRPSRPPEPGLVTLPVDAKWLAHRAEGDELLLRDTRGSKRRLLLAAAAPGGFVVSTEKTTYLGTGTRLKAGKKDSTKLGGLPAVEQSIPLAAGDVVRLTRDCTPAPVDDDQAPRIGCTLPEVFGNAAVGQRVFFDDIVGGRVIAVDARGLDVRIDRPPHGTAKMRAAMAISLPDTDLPVSALTDKDLADLAAAVELADIVQLSFVRAAAEVKRVFKELDRLGDHELGVVLKIEPSLTDDQRAQLLLTALRRRRVGVIIAPGDSALETLHWCEAAHLPVIDDID
ncbi:hypothetical protein H7H98_02490 [Mycolicibacterium sphagni]|nr:hypothetical protein [Mycolicibacterium sphagni]